jgi:hypothetical protein
VFLLFSVAFCTVEPFSAAGGADGDLGVEDVFAIRINIGTVDDCGR